MIAQWENEWNRLKINDNFEKKINFFLMTERKNELGHSQIMKEQNKKVKNAHL